MKIVTDCAADMSAEELEQLGVIAAPLFIQFPEGEVNSTDISADDFYNRLEAMRPQIPTTAQPSGGIFAELYRKVAQTEKNVLSIHISSGLSGTINAAHDGGEQAKGKANVSYWETLTLSGGERFQVLAAAFANKAGWIYEMADFQNFSVIKTVSFSLYHPGGTPSKARLVQRHFSNIASRYDIANDILSFGLQRTWKSLAVRMLDLNPGELVLDVCGGTADLARLATKPGRAGPGPGL